MVIRDERREKKLASSTAITTSTASKLSRPKSFVKDALGVN